VPAARASEETSKVRVAPFRAERATTWRIRPEESGTKWLTTKPATYSKSANDRHCLNVRDGV
jgi:hypothetical protein